jgi:hypothetical protein
MTLTVKDISDGTGDKIKDQLPLEDNEDAILVVVDKEKWEIRVYYEGSPATLVAIDSIMKSATEMFKDQIKLEDQEVDEGLVN